MIPAQTGIHVIFSCGVSSYSDQAVIVSFTDFYRKLKKIYINLFENLFLFENENRTRTKKFLIFANKNRTRTKNILNAANENRTRTKKISVFFHPCSILMSHNLWVIRMSHQVAPEFELFSFCWDCLFTGLHNLQF